MITDGRTHVDTKTYWGSEEMSASILISCPMSLTPYPSYTVTIHMGCLLCLRLLLRLRRIQNF